MAKAGKESAPAPVSVASGGHKCLSFNCTKKPTRAEFCDEHFKWFKIGLITVKGERAKDFDKKIQQADRLLAMLDT